MLLIVPLLTTKADHCPVGAWTKRATHNHSICAISLLYTARVEAAVVLACVMFVRVSLRVYCVSGKKRCSKSNCSNLFPRMARRQISVLFSLFFAPKTDTT